MSVCAFAIAKAACPVSNRWQHRLSGDSATSIATRILQLHGLLSATEVTRVKVNHARLVLTPRISPNSTCSPTVGSSPSSLAFRFGIASDCAPGSSSTRRAICCTRCSCQYLKERPLIVDSTTSAVWHGKL